MGQRDEPTLEFPYGFDEGIAFEAERLGVYYYAVVRLTGGDRVRVSFYDAFRVAQDLEREQGREGSCVALPGMIVIPKVTRQYMESAVRELSSGDYFDDLKRLLPDAPGGKAWQPEPPLTGKLETGR
jgi:hypothetical protein